MNKAKAAPDRAAHATSTNSANCKNSSTAPPKVSRHRPAAPRRAPHRPHVRFLAWQPVLWLGAVHYQARVEVGGRILLADVWPGGRPVIARQFAAYLLTPGELQAVRRALRRRWIQGRSTAAEIARMEVPA